MWIGNEQSENKCKDCRDYNPNGKCYVKTCMVDFRKALDKMDTCVMTVEYKCNICKEEFEYREEECEMTQLTFKEVYLQEELIKKLEEFGYNYSDACKINRLISKRACGIIGKVKYELIGMHGTEDGIHKFVQLNEIICDFNGLSSDGVRTYLSLNEEIMKKFNLKTN